LQFGLEPACVVGRTSFDKGNARHHSGVSENGRTALGAEVSVNRLTAIPFAVKGLEPPYVYCDSKEHWTPIPEDSQQFGKMPA
jgi:hypothetical protein